MVFPISELLNHFIGKLLNKNSKYEVSLRHTGHEKISLFCDQIRGNEKKIYYHLFGYNPKKKELIIDSIGSIDFRVVPSSPKKLSEEINWGAVKDISNPSNKPLDIPYIFEYSIEPPKRFPLLYEKSKKFNFCYSFYHIKIKLLNCLASILRIVIRFFNSAAS